MIALIAAFAKNQVIGYKGRIPWKISGDIEGDTYFPPFESGQFVKEVNERFEGEIPYTYVTYTRKQGNIE